MPVVNKHYLQFVMHVQAPGLSAVWSQPGRAEGLCGALQLGDHHRLLPALAKRTARQRRQALLAPRLLVQPFRVLVRHY